MTEVGAGYSSRAAFRLEFGGPSYAYGEANVVDAGRMIPLLSEGLRQEIDKAPDNDAQSGSAIGGSEVTAIRAGGPIRLQLVYGGLEALLCAALGASHYHNSPEVLAVGAYKHTIHPAANLEDGPWPLAEYTPPTEPVMDLARRGTLCLDKGVGVWEYRSCMVNTLTIKGDSQGCRVEAELIAYDLDLDSTANPNADAWTVPVGDFPRVLFNDLRLLIAPFSASVALANPGDSLGVRSFALKIDNKLDAVPDSRSGLHIAQPQRRQGEKRQVTLDITLPRYTSNTWLAALSSQQAMMARLLFTGGELAGGHKYGLDIWLPTLRLDAGQAAISGPGLLAPDHTLSAELPSALPAGFPALATTNEIVVQVVSGLASNPLQDP